MINKTSETKEIELIDYLLVIWKWKGVIAGGVLISVLLVGMMSYKEYQSQPIVYRTKMIAQPHRILGDKTRESINKPIMLQTMIEGEIIVEALKYFKKNKDRVQNTTINFKYEPDEIMHLLKIYIETESPGDGIFKMDYLAESIKKKYSELIKPIRNEYKLKIENKKRELSILKVSIKALNEDYESDITEREYFLRKLKLDLNQNKKLLSYTRNRLGEIRAMEKFQKNNSKLIDGLNTTQINTKESPFFTLLSKYFYQQDMLLTNRVKRDFDFYHFKEQVLLLEIEKIAIDIQNTERDMNQLQFKNKKQGNSNSYFLEKHKIQQEIDLIPIRIEALIEKERRATHIKIQRFSPVQIKRESKVFNNTALAFIVSLFVLIILTFFIEYIKEYIIGRDSLK